MTDAEILKNAPDDTWTHYANITGRYYYLDGPRLMVWLEHTSVWSVPIAVCQEHINLRSRTDLEKLESLRSQLATEVQNALGQREMKRSAREARDKLIKQLATARADGIDLNKMLHEVANQYDGDDTTEWSIGANHVFKLFTKWVFANQLDKDQGE